MIQRIQTIYLLLIALISGLLIFVNPSYAELKGFDKWTQGEKGNISVRFNTAVYDVKGNVVQTENLSLMTYTLAVICLLALFGIFLFKNRRLQALLTAFNYIFILILIALMVYYIVRYRDNISQEVETDAAIGLFFPLFLPVFNFMALRRISYDEELVRSSDRIR
ncbi:MAG TPA: DUF4293 domain-containing protein [Bacteroidia bacterium]|nr:DUF4293 domain-containing protein [Bacteroidia bacterium]